uniref:Uncharacterized protein n=1 Tax=Salix viminalis TaxID=40686 RepID=A0A6N2N2Q9_SALVM
MLFLTSQWIVFNSKKYNFIYLTKKIYYRCSCVKSATNFLLLIQKTCNGLSYTKSTQDPFISVKYNPFSLLHLLTAGSIFNQASSRNIDLLTG